MNKDNRHRLLELVDSVIDQKDICFDYKMILGQD